MVTIRPLSLSLSRPLSRELVWLTDADPLALDLQFATDKTLTARKGPTPVFTRASTGTFIGSNGLIQSAANHAARFDHDPITRACNGLLIEESRANLLKYSQEFENIAWTPTASTVSANVAVAPDGTTTADKLIPTVTSSQHYASSTITSAASTYTVTVYAKADGYNWLWFNAAGSGSPATDLCWFDVLNGVTGTAQVNATTSIQSMGNGWFRCVCSWAAFTVGTPAIWIAISTANNQSTAFAGDGTSGIIIWGAQIEAGPSASSYIPTTTASVVRSADVCSIAEADFTSFWNRFAGTCVVGVGSSGASVTGFANTFIGTSPSTRTFAIFGSTAISFAVPPPNFSGTIVASGATYPIKLGLAYAINDYQTTYNGNLGGSVTDTNGTIPDSTDLRIGCDSFITFGTKHIQFVRYYKKRLPNAKLQSLTI